MPATPSRLIVTAAAAAERGLPAVGFSADLEGASLWGGPFPDDQTYASLSGPPGGPLWVVIKPLPGDRADHATLEDFVRGQYPAEVPAFGEPGEIDVGRSNRPAVLFFVGQKHPMTASGAIAVGIEVPDTPWGPAAIAIIAGCGGTPDFLTDPLAVAGHPSLCRVLESFQLGDEDAAGGQSTADEVPLPPRVEVPDPFSDAAEVADEAEGDAGDEGAAAVDDEEREPDSDSAPDIIPGLATAEVKALLNEVRRAMQRAGLWRDTPPGMDDYAGMGAAGQMAWSLQATLPSVAVMLQQIAGHGPEVERGAVDGIRQMLAAWPDLFRPYPEAAEVVAVLERGAGAP